MELWNSPTWPGLRAHAPISLQWLQRLYVCVFSRSRGIPMCSHFFCLYASIIGAGWNRNDLQKQARDKDALVSVISNSPVPCLLFLLSSFPLPLESFDQKKQKKNENQNIQHFNWSWQAKLVQILIHPLKWNSKRCTVTPVFYFPHLNK